ncbi:hypothetical protein NEISICOT_02123 [Neisseria sicca ATCC 29256]|uniref:Uncharacterized protein n=1 Tax=Neisseria sicca ATCC 29256 TaxID=547045 RepID=C6M6H1_NEISI|nr:hypothetical protein NEISICOT_02123 [Neisseria sicca ATCC 29256]
MFKIKKTKRSSENGYGGFCANLFSDDLFDNIKRNQTAVFLQNISGLRNSLRMPLSAPLSNQNACLFFGQAFSCGHDVRLNI